MQQIYTNTMKVLNENSPDVIYFAVGCFMGYYKDITPSNNQQNPKFMNKFEGKNKIYIFMDPMLESPLKLESQMMLVQTDTDEKYRVLENGEYTVIAINQPYYFYNRRDETEKYELDSLFLYGLVNYALEKNIKLIVQDYSGCDIAKAYLKLIDIFDKQSILKNVLFDVTQNDGGCFVDFDKYTIEYDSKDNFFQNKFESLVKLKKINEDFFKDILVRRVNLVSYYICRYIRMINGELEMTDFDTAHIKDIVEEMSMIYSIKKDVTLDNLKELIMMIMLDASEALEIPISTVNHIMEQNFNQSIVTNITSMMKSLC